MHDHPEGEEILVLEGVFSDEHGDWAAGTYLLNPEGFRHAPFSEPGCLLFVKLRQFAGVERHHVVVDTQQLSWEPTSIPGVTRKVLYQQRGFYDVTLLERWDHGTNPGLISYAEGAELFVLQGEFADQYGEYRSGCWLRLPAGFGHLPRSDGVCILYVKKSVCRYLRSSAAR